MKVSEQCYTIIDYYKNYKEVYIELSILGSFEVCLKLHVIQLMSLKTKSISCFIEHRTYVKSLSKKKKNLCEITSKHL